MILANGSSLEYIMGSSMRVLQRSKLKKPSKTIRKYIMLLEKDILSVDLRLPDRVAFRLGADAATARAEALAKKAPKKGDHA